MWEWVGDTDLFVMRPELDVVCGAVRARARGRSSNGRTPAADVIRVTHARDVRVQVLQSVLHIRTFSLRIFGRALWRRTFVCDELIDIVCVTSLYTMT